MPTAVKKVAPTPRQIFALAKLSESDLLVRVKADLLTSLAVDALAARDVRSVLAGLSKLIETIRVFRERTARAAGAKLAPVIAGMFSDGGAGLCQKLRYCERRHKLRGNLERIRDAVTLAEVGAELAEIAEALATIIEFLSNLKLPLSMIFLILFYSLDEVCKCPRMEPRPRGRRRPRKRAP